MSGTSGTRSRLTLLVTGTAPRSRRARDNLARALKTLSLHPTLVEEIDLIADPSPAIRMGIFACPTLVRVPDEQEPAVLYGDLSDERELRQFLADLADANARGAG